MHLSWTSKFLLGLVAIACSSLPLHAQRARTVRLSPVDKRRIVSLAFAEGLSSLIDDERFRTCSIPIVDEKKLLLVETTEPKIVAASVPGYTLRPLPRSGIEAEIKDNGGDCYFVIRVPSRTPIPFKIVLWRSIDVITGKYPDRWFGSTGRVYEVRKRHGRWSVKFRHGTAIVT